MSEISIKKATLINAFAKYSTVVMNLIFMAILARLLKPEDFGVVAIITVFTAFFAILSDMGFGTAIIQNKELTANDVSSIFSYSIYIAVALAMLFSLLSIPISILYNNDVYKLICSLLSIAIIFDTLNMVPNALLMKDKRFVLVGIRLIVVNIVTGIITIIFALAGFRYYALVLQSVLSSAITFIWNYSSTRPKFMFRYNKSSIQKIKSYSGFQFGFSIVNYFSRNLDNLLIGKFMGNSQLAFYDKGYKLMLYPVGYLTNVITPALHPILSEHQRDKEYIYQQYMRIVKVLSLFGVFITAYCFSTNREIILIIFGSKWQKSIPAFQILSFSVWGQMIASSSGSIFQSLGDTKGLFRCGVITTIGTVTCIITGVLFHNILAVAYFVVIAYLFNFIVTYVMLFKYSFEYSFLKFVKHIYKDFIMMIAIILIMRVIPIDISNNFISAIVKGLFCAVLYLFGLLATKQLSYFTSAIGNISRK